MPKYHPQLWMVFFGPGRNVGRIATFLPRPWQHVCCASYNDELKVWQYVNPARDRTYFLTLPPEKFSDYFAVLLNTSTAIVEFPAHDERTWCPTWASCVGVVKGIVGINSWAMTPHALFMDLMARGASLVSQDDPPEDNEHVIDFRRRRTPATAGRPGGDAPAADRGSASAS